ncbi:MAG: DUF2058 family protein [Myxococcota bacterium]
MSLKDQLVAKGFASKKRARAVDRQLKQERKKRQSSKKRKSQLRAEADEATRQRAEIQQAARQASRRDAERAREAAELPHRVRQLVMAHRLGARGPHPFFVKRRDGCRVARLQVSEAMARDLRAGRAAVVELDAPDGSDLLHVVGPKAVGRLLELAPDVLVHWVTDTSHFDDPSEVLLQRAWEASLVPHRYRGCVEA